MKDQVMKPSRTLFAPFIALHAAKTPKQIKANIGFGGESGGPAGEKAGALEFRHLKITATP